MIPHRSEDPRSKLLGPIELLRAEGFLVTLRDGGARVFLGREGSSCSLPAAFSLLCFFSSLSHVTDLPLYALTSVCKWAAWGNAEVPAGCPLAALALIRPL